MRVDFIYPLFCIAKCSSIDKFFRQMDAHHIAFRRIVNLLPFFFLSNGKIIIQMGLI
jgi:hypothetical protein